MIKPLIGLKIVTIIPNILWVLLIRPAFVALLKILIRVIVSKIDKGMQMIRKISLGSINNDLRLLHKYKYHFH